ncbi:MAG: hypothetical protein A3F71_15840 [Burkholderiales bacterium RIFCSPLOWO2_12_FULL_64_33]|nr:MAG: hypothetical protein A3F71_15840 [Burkholderiales bacterium RIFCSPLOWO2_12_FULL_64_33]
MQRKIAQGVEELVARVVRQTQHHAGIRVRHLHKAWLAASVRYIHAFAVPATRAWRRGTGDEQGVGTLHARDGGGVQSGAQPLHRARSGQRSAQAWLPRLDVFGAVAKALHHLHVQAVIAKRCHPPVHAVAPPRVRLQPEHAHGRAWRQVY